VHVGVHWTSDVVAGAALGAGLAALTRRWWPVRDTDEARARPATGVPVLPGGEGVLMLVNQLAGDPRRDPVGEVAAALPRAEILTLQQGRGIEHQLETALRRGAQVGDEVRALGVAGGDGSVGAAAALAHRRGLPLVVAPTGTLNHFARDVGVYDLVEVTDATGAGEAVAVDLGLVEVHPPVGDPDAVVRTRTFLNTASIGSYPELVRLRERWQPRWGKWPAFAAALAVVLRRAQPVRVRFLGQWRTVWFLFVGNGPYHPRGMVPAWRPTLSAGLLDVRWLRADVRFSRLRVAAALLLGALGHSRVYGQREVRELDVELAVPALLATDGEVVGTSGRYTFRIADGPVAVYRRDERHWRHRRRPLARGPARRAGPSRGITDRTGS
jgi:undecaprenyl-diphosphatase